MLDDRKAAGQAVLTMRPSPACETLVEQQKTAPRIRCANTEWIPQGLADRRKGRSTMSSLPPEVPTRVDRAVKANPISRELAAELAVTIMRSIKPSRNACWIRTAAVNPKTGYTQVSKKIDGRSRYFYAHRIMYTFAIGPIPEGLTLDHLCERRACCNPLHLEAVSLRTNVLRSKTNPTAINARREKCKRGHNYIKVADGRRFCPTCASATAKRRYAKKVAERAQGGAR